MPSLWAILPLWEHLGNILSIRLVNPNRYMKSNHTDLDCHLMIWSSVFIISLHRRPCLLLVSSPMQNKSLSNYPLNCNLIRSLPTFRTDLDLTQLSYPSFQTRTNAAPQNIPHKECWNWCNDIWRITPTSRYIRAGTVVTSAAPPHYPSNSFGLWSGWWWWWKGSKKEREALISGRAWQVVASNEDDNLQLCKRRRRRHVHQQ